MLPLYEEVPEVPEKSSDANTGLWFERFFNQFNQDATEILESKKINDELTQGKNFWLQQFKSAGNTDALQAAAQQQMNLVKQLKGKHKFFNTQWHFVTGTGYPHPVENGLLWHPVYGVPYLSGAAVKGLVRAWVEEWEFADIKDESDRESKKRERLLAWFGSDYKLPKDQQQPVQTGDLIFFDALPVKSVRLVTDIMTPHQDEWYSDGGNIKDVVTEHKKIPADWHDPNPIPFLVVDKATSYLFSIAPRHAQVTEATMNEVIECLTQALEWLGAGAKTATGYGGFNVYNDPLDKQWKAKNQSLKEELKNMEEKQLITAFSKNYNITKAAYQNKGYDWKEVVNLVWKYHEPSIDSWASSGNKNAQKAYIKLVQDKDTS